MDDEALAVILAAVERQKLSKGWIKDGGQYIPHPATWLNKRRWEDAVTTAQGDDAHPGWAINAGFSNRFDAENAGCSERNSNLFAEGRRREIA